MKKVLLIICLLLLTGCSVESNVVMSDNGSVKEEVTVLAKNNIFKSEQYSPTEMINFIIDDYKTILNYKKYNYDIILKNELSGAKFNKTYNSICDYFGDTGFNKYVYNHIKCEENDKYIEITNDTKYIPYCSNCSDWPLLDEVTFNLKLPIKPVNHNADEVMNDEYIWNFGKNVNYDKKFYLKIDKQALIDYNINRRKMNNIKLICIFVSLFTIFGIVSYILYKKYKKNKLEY